MRRLRCGAAALGACAVIGAAGAGGATASVQVGSSGWSWGNPLPQGNTLRAMAFAGTTGYAVGDFGTLLKTTDAGDTWSGLPAGTFSNLTEVEALDGGSTVVAGGGCVARLSVDGGQSFTRIAFTPVESSCPDGSHLAALWYVSATHGYILLNDGSVLETNNGTDFATKTAIPGTRQAGGGVQPTDIVFLTDTSGFVTTADGNIYATTDSGVSWKSVSNTNRPVRAISFASSKVGYAVGDGGLFLKTSDGGATWVPKDTGVGENYSAVRCADESACVTTTQSGTKLVITTTGGNAFSLPTLSTDPLLAAAFASPTRLAAAGQQGSTVVSDDAGANSRPIGGRLTGSFTRVVAGKVPGTAFAPGPNATLGKTVDGGKTWTRGNVITTANVLDVSFPTADDGYALDVAGGLFRTSSGGSFWKTLDTGSTARPGAVYAPSGDVVMVIGPTGVRRSVDGGGSFDGVRCDVARTSLDRVDRAGSTIVAYGRQDVVRSVDNGKTWKALRKPGKYVRKSRRSKLLVNRLGIRRVDFIDAGHGFLLDASGRLWRTSNGGGSWTELPGVGTNAARGMSFSTASKGYLVISTFGDVRQPTGFLLRTDDGGATWHPQFVVSSPIADDGVAAGGGTDYLLGGEQSLLYSTTGGDSGASSELSIAAPKTRYAKPAHIVVTGKLAPASGNERVTVAYRRPGSTRWTTQTVSASANGSYTTSWNLARGANQFVAQWQGNFRSHGDGSKVLTVTVGKGKSSSKKK
jgi:photosystem II stability/assembly factor-like uncharacterized protein